MSTTTAKGITIMTTKQAATQPQDELVRLREELAVLRAAFLAAVGGDPHAVSGGTITMTDLQVRALCETYEMRAGARGLPGPYRVWYRELAEGLGSVLTWRRTEERHMA